MVHTWVLSGHDRLLLLNISHVSIQRSLWRGAGLGGQTLHWAEECRGQHAGTPTERQHKWEQPSLSSPSRFTLHGVFQGSELYSDSCLRSVRNIFTQQDCQCMSDSNTHFCTAQSVLFTLYCPCWKKPVSISLQTLQHCCVWAAATLGFMPDMKSTEQLTKLQSTDSKQELLQDVCFSVYQQYQ